MEEALNNQRKLSTNTQRTSGLEEQPSTSVENNTKKEKESGHVST